MRGSYSESDMFVKNLIPALVKLMIWVKDDMSKKVIFFNFCHFSNGKSIHFEMSAATKKMSFEEDVLGIVRLTQARDTFLPTTQKERKGEKERKSQKNVSKRHKIQNGPPSGTKQSIWRGYTTGL